MSPNRIKPGLQISPTTHQENKFEYMTSQCMRQDKTVASHHYADQILFKLLMFQANIADITIQDYKNQ